MEILMKDFERYSKEFYLKIKNFTLTDATKSHHLPNSEDLHNMVCNYGKSEFEDTMLFDRAEFVDFLNYEKELWNLNKTNK